MTAQWFGQMYFAGKFTSAWDALTPAAQQAVPQGTWVGVHEGCASDIGGHASAIRSVTILGSAAIISEQIDGARSQTVQYILSYLNGGWRYAPGDLSVYARGSVAADIAAAKASGLCAGWKVF